MLKEVPFGTSFFVFKFATGGSRLKDGLFGWSVQKHYPTSSQTRLLERASAVFTVHTLVLIRVNNVKVFPIREILFCFFYYIKVEIGRFIVVSLVAIMIYATIQFAGAKSAVGGILYVGKRRGLLRNIRFALTNSQSETIGEFGGAAEKFCGCKIRRRGQRPRSPLRGLPSKKYVEKRGDFLLNERR